MVFFEKFDSFSVVDGRSRRKRRQVSSLGIFGNSGTGTYGSGYSSSLGTYPYNTYLASGAYGQQYAPYRNQYGYNLYGQNYGSSYGNYIPYNPAYGSNYPYNSVYGYGQSGYPNVGGTGYYGSNIYGTGWNTNQYPYNSNYGTYGSSGSSLYNSGTPWYLSRFAASRSQYPTARKGDATEAAAEIVPAAKSQVN
ncbi:unnamed protein product [Didymodactylos carnosus]|uniref:Uncharacterized protein n=1 Tax=Didymodactylos carnosus TaxID=1234261 RepID=A0A814QFY4_9BILA|nr:unnamed protein product [Didymodactylos carnosus]CAF1119349.1 unnamed protein product [Didymodactylos carnosus]CAF3713706.1 unnamed protein product [Didymodactylos carnosus]CAF3883023.1 unnamed protein product [Didymodactylos carnosus]